MLPKETILALFPAGRTVRRRWPLRPLRLNPVTIAHAAAMEALGCGMLDGFIGDADALAAAWLLSRDANEVMRTFDRGLNGARRFAERCTLTGLVSSNLKLV